MEQLIIRLSSPNEDKLNSFVKKRGLQRIPKSHRTIDGKFSIDIIVSKSDLVNLQELISSAEVENATSENLILPMGYSNTFSTARHNQRLEFDVINSLTELEKKILSWVGKGNRFNENFKLPQIFESYLNVEEIETSLKYISDKYKWYVKLNELPYQTFNSKKSFSIKLSNDTDNSKTGILIIGGVHGNEWVPPDSLVYLMYLMAEIALNGNVMKTGEYKFLPLQIEEILSKLNVYIFPLVNPDGRSYSQDVNGYIYFRKNRKCFEDKLYGVDLNRNYDFLWNFERHFYDLTKVDMSTDKSDITYVGESAFSENETLNVRSIVNKFPNIKYFIDLHSYGKEIKFNWSHENIQTSDNKMIYTNRKYRNRKIFWGPYNYKEYVSIGDNVLRHSLASVMKQAIISATGSKYNVIASTDKPMSGTSKSYFDSLAYKIPYRKINSFVIECGESFHPDIPLRTKVIKEISAALIEFLYTIAQSESNNV